MSMLLNRAVMDFGVGAHAGYSREPVSMGTTIIAAEYDGGVVLGADTRTSSGSLVVNRVADKLTEVTPTIFVCRSGSAADTQAITDIAKHHLDIFELQHGHKAGVNIAAQIFRDMSYQYRDQLMAGLIVAGWDKENGGQVYSIPIGGMIARQPLTAGGSGSTYIYGYLDQNFKPKMSQADCETFVKNAVSFAIYRDGSSGGVVRLGTITEKGMERKTFTPEKLCTVSLA